MAEEQHTNVETGEIKDRGVFDFLRKKEEEKPQEEVIAAELEKVHVSEPEKVHVSESEVKIEEEEEKKPSLLEKLHRSGSSSSSSSSDEEEVEEGGEKIKKKKKKGLKEKIEEKISGEKEEEKKFEQEDTSIPIEKYDEVPAVISHPEDVKTPEEKKSFMEKIKDKLPGTHKKPQEYSAPAAPVPTPAPVEYEGEAKEKKGMLEKIKEKLPGYHKTEEEKKEADH